MFLAACARSNQRCTYEVTHRVSIGIYGIRSVVLSGCLLRVLHLLDIVSDEILEVSRHRLGDRRTWLRGGIK